MHGKMCGGMGWVVLEVFMVVWSKAPISMRIWCSFSLLGPWACNGCNPRSWTQGGCIARLVIYFPDYASTKWCCLVRVPTVIPWSWNRNRMIGDQACYLLTTVSLETRLIFALERHGGEGVSIINDVCGLGGKDCCTWKKVWCLFWSIHHPFSHPSIYSSILPSIHPSLFHP